MDADAKRKKPIVKLRLAANLDIDAARRLLADPPNVLAANHLQQAAEKIISAVRLHRGLLNTKDHDLVILVDGRSPGAHEALTIRRAPHPSGPLPNETRPGSNRSPVARSSL